MITSIINLLLFLGFTTKSTFLRNLIYLDIRKSLISERKPYTLNSWLYMGICQFLYKKYGRSVRIYDLTELTIACRYWIGVRRDTEFWTDPYKVSMRLVIVEGALQIIENEKSKKR